LDEDEDVDELDKFSSVNNTERKRFDKLDNLNSILELVDIHEKTTQNQIVDEKEIKRLNMVRNKKKLELYHTCITYNKNNLFFNKNINLFMIKLKTLITFIPIHKIIKLSIIPIQKIKKEII
jgi:hypothetical protein